MPLVSRSTLFTLAALAFAGTGALAGAVWWGLYDVGADTPHSRPVFALLETVRERSIAARAAGLVPPDLADAARIRHGAGNYAAMCVDCHGAPGLAAGELQRGLYPAPPALAREAVEPRAAFWTIKHGIKASAMPAWGGHMDDDAMWNLVAFVEMLPTLDADAYARLVAESGGHSHGGGVGAAEAANEHPGDPFAASAAPTTAAPTTTHHVHADGSIHEHTAPAPDPDAHDHEHH